MLPGVSRRCGPRTVALAVLLALSTGAGARAQTASAPALTAAFLYNFALFTEWPADALPAKAPLVLCVADQPKVARALKEATKGRDVGGHAFSVRTIELNGPVLECHLLYADRLDARGAAALLAKIKGAPILSVSDFSSFAQLGGIAHLFLEGGRMRFAVNLDAANRTKLRLSSRLLSLAVIVKDDVNVSRP